MDFLTFLIRAVNIVLVSFRYFGDFRSIDVEPRNSISYDTCTYFDKHVVDTANLQERYTKEIEQLRGKLRELKGEQQAKYEQRRRHLLDDVAYSPKELLLKTTENATTNNSVTVAAVINNDSNNSINQKVVSETTNTVKEVQGKSLCKAKIIYGGVFF